VQQVGAVRPCGAGVVALEIVGLYVVALRDLHETLTLLT
tara:strand:+ start:552 stop:668 length:117 start_codon:yes stop_codon:yes gene_type:complete